MFPVALDELTSRLLLGPHTSRQRLMSDPIRAVGARQYVSGDPLRAIDWRATGRRGALMVRELEPSTAPAIQIVLDFRIHQPSGDWIEPDELEFAISVAASIATYGARRGWRLGLRGNSRTTGGAPLAIPASRSPRQLHAVLEALARAGSRPNGSLVDLLCACEHEQRETAAWLVISSQIDERAQALLERMHSRGQTVLVLAITAREQRSEFGRLPVRYVSYDAGWMNRGALAFYA